MLAKESYLNSVGNWGYWKNLNTIKKIFISKISLLQQCRGVGKRLTRVKKTTRFQARENEG